MRRLYRRFAKARLSRSPDINLALLERWLTGWSLSRGLPPPYHQGGGLVVDVGFADQLRRHVFVDADAQLQACAAAIDEAFVYIKAAVTPAQLRAALPARWMIETPRYVMRIDGSMQVAPVPAGYRAIFHTEHGATVVRLVDENGAVAASGGLVMVDATAIFDRIETAASHRRRGLGRAIMGALEQLAREHGASERLLIATDAGRALYETLGWQVLAPYATAVLAPVAAKLVENRLRWQHGTVFPSRLPFNFTPETP
jgi:GNAT superfamily N-acetyltransferase